MPNSTGLPGEAEDVHRPVDGVAAQLLVGSCTPALEAWRVGQDHEAGWGLVAFLAETDSRCCLSGAHAHLLLALDRRASWLLSFQSVCSCAPSLSALPLFDGLLIGAENVRFRLLEALTARQNLLLVPLPLNGSDGLLLLLQEGEALLQLMTEKFEISDLGLEFFGVRRAELPLVVDARG